MGHHHPSFMPNPKEKPKLSKARELELLGLVERLSDSLESLRLSLKKKRYWLLYKEFDRVSDMGWAGCRRTCKLTLRAAQDSGEAISVRDKNDRHVEWAVIED